jgi:hypothetical protein
VQGRSDQTGSEGKFASPRAFVPTITTDGEALTPDRVFVRRTPIGYLCAGFGNASKLLQFAFEAEEQNSSRFDAACRRLNESIIAEGVTKAHRLGLDIPLGAIGDRHLRRLAIATALLKAGFDPSQPRDDHGRWTDGGGASGDESDDSSGTGSNGTAAGYMDRPGVEADAPTAPKAPPGADIPGAARWSIWSRLWGGLAAIAEAAVAPVALAGALCLIPLNRGLVTEGTLPDHSEISYRFALSETETSLTLYRTDEHGDRQIIFQGYRDVDGYYRDDQGNIVARFAEGALVIDPAAASAIANREFNVGQPDAVAQPATSPTAAAQSDATLEPRNQPIACPTTSTEDFKGRSPEAIAYELQVTGKNKPGIDYKINGVSFDGCRQSDGVMLEAKGEGYEKHLGPDGKWEGYFAESDTGWEEMRKQIDRQAQAARDSGRQVEWHVAEPRVADYIAAYMQRSGYSHMRVIYEPRRISSE